MLIYLRHGDDRGDDTYRHDRRLNDRGRKKAGKAAVQLIEEHGRPDVVYVSPYRRALDTLEAMSLTRPVIHYDRRIAQCLSGKQQRDPKISPETAAQVTIIEDRDAFRRRVAEHVAEVRAARGVVWCITHQAVVEEVARQLDVKISGKLGFCEHVVMVAARG